VENDQQHSHTRRHRPLFPFVFKTDVFVVCLSKKAITKSGFVQKEVKYALDIADEQPEGAIFIIPVRLDMCKVPYRLRQWQWVDYFEENGMDRFIQALRTRAASFKFREI
jgi:hypothetical protein